MVNSYSYMNEDEIDDELKCAICRQPFIEPVSSTLCHHTFCKECIIACINRERCCPVCRADSYHEHYQPIRSRVLLNQLNRLRVCCDACQAGNIQRGYFQDHIQNCPNWVIPCTASDIRCEWRGMRNQLANHVRSCPFQRIRPIVDHLQGEIQSHTKQINDLKEAHSRLVFFMIAAMFFCALILLYSQGTLPHSQETLPHSQETRQPRTIIDDFRAWFTQK